MDRPDFRRSKSFADKVLTLLLAFVISVSLGIMAAIAIPYIADMVEADKLKSIYIQDDSLRSESSSQQEVGQLPYPMVNWDDLLRDNSDVVGWIYVPGTNIDYPVVAAPESDPTYYLRRDLRGNWSVAGTLYLDSECARDLTSHNVVVFGHHLMDGSMFSVFASYVDEDYFNEHRDIYILTPDGAMRLKAVAVNVVDANVEEKRTVFKDENDFVAYWQAQLAESEVVSNDAPATPSQVFCFVTCSYQADNARTLVYAVSTDELEE